MKKRIIILSFAFLLTASMLAGFVYAEFWACFNKGERIDYCSNYKPSTTCDSSNGCQKCMSVYDEQENCYVHGSWPKCNQLLQECSNTGGSPEIDGEAPILDIDNPVQDSLYTSRSVLLEFSLNEEADVFYIDNINGRGRWTKVCENCYSYSRSRGFNEGLNDLTFKAVDVVGNEMYINRSFFVDSKKPQIHKTQPRSRFVNGLFEIQYTEDNLESIEINYGNFYSGFQTKELSGCASGRRQWCGIDVDLSSYEEDGIEYHFIVKDKAGNIKESKRINLEADTIAPAINLLDYSVTGKYVSFKINITEKNLDKVEYLDYGNGDRWKTLCSSLKNGMCEKKKSFREGHHIVDVQVTDEAGNAVANRIEFDI